MTRAEFILRRLLDGQKVVNTFPSREQAQREFDRLQVIGGVMDRAVNDPTPEHPDRVRIEPDPPEAQR